MAINQFQYTYATHFGRAIAECYRAAAESCFPLDPELQMDAGRIAACAFIERLNLAAEKSGWDAADLQFLFPVASQNLVMERINDL